MNPIDFIAKNVKSELLKQGYADAVAQGGANAAVDHYRRCSSASKKGAMFDDCLYFGKAWAQKHALADEKPGNKRKERRVAQQTLL